VINQKVSRGIWQWRATAEKRENEPKEPHKIKKEKRRERKTCRLFLFEIKVKCAKNVFADECLEDDQTVFSDLIHR
jgi:hypothetical protein